MSLSEALAEAQSEQCLMAIAQRYRITADQARDTVHYVRPVILGHIEAGLAQQKQAVSFLKVLAQPVFTQIEHAPHTVVDQDVRLSGDAIHRQLSRHDGELWTTLDGIAREVGLSHQTLRAMMPSLTLMILSALRRAATPAFLRLLMQERPNDTGTDPFAFARDHADSVHGERTSPRTTLRWLDLVLSKADDMHGPLFASPDDRI